VVEFAREHHPFVHLDERPVVDVGHGRVLAVLAVVCQHLHCVVAEVAGHTDLTVPSVKILPPDTMV
jgi:hypothetical protein